MRISGTAIRSTARKGLRRVGLDVANPRSDYSSIAAVGRLTGRGSIVESCAASRLAKGVSSFACNGVEPQGQLLQDVLACGDLTGQPYFVEVGAAHPRELSNTVTLVDHFQWHGLRVDPNPVFAELHEQLSIPGVTFRRAAVGTDEGAVVPFLVAGSLSTRMEHVRSDGHADARRRIATSESVVQVPIRRLDSLLTEVDAPEWIDYMSIDTEGSELDVLESFPWSEHKVGLITVEYNFDNARREAFDRLLAAQGLHRVLSDFSAWDAWYLNEALCRSG